MIINIHDELVFSSKTDVGLSVFFEVLLNDDGKLILQRLSIKFKILKITGAY